MSNPVTTKKVSADTKFAALNIGTSDATSQIERIVEINNQASGAIRATRRMRDLWLEDLFITRLDADEYEC